MTVSELVTELQKLPQHIQVIIQKDPEGNGYSPLSGVDGNCIYIAERPWSGDVKSLNWTADDVCLSEEDWNNLKAMTPECCVIWPLA